MGTVYQPLNYSHHKHWDCCISKTCQLSSATYYYQCTNLEQEKLPYNILDKIICNPCSFGGEEKVTFALALG